MSAETVTSTELVLPPKLHAALEECASFTRNRQRYWWRQASMRKLESLGLVGTEAGDTRKVPCWWATPQGLKYLETCAK